MLFPARSALLPGLLEAAGAPSLTHLVLPALLYDCYICRGFASLPAERQLTTATTTGQNDAAATPAQPSDY
jgi:hypothetical protein